MGMKLFGDIYRGRRVLLSGHTGFKGSWLAAWLDQMGSNITGLALDSYVTPNHWNQLNLPADDRRVDIRNLSNVQSVFDQTQPEIIFHLAAQSLVRRSYRDPIESWSTNVMGTANILEACRNTPSVKVVVVVTTDKVYANNEWPWGYREIDQLGGHDPYSASKAASELVVDSYRKSFFQKDNSPLIASARAGNVIGGGDWSEDRLIPDLVRAVQNQSKLEIRSPQARRPWQHVLECLSGYLLLGQRLFEGKKEFAEAWNFGPTSEDNLTVEEVLKLLQVNWPKLIWQTTKEEQPHEASLLYLDCAKSRSQLNWVPVWSLEQGVTETANWYTNFNNNNQIITLDQLRSYLESAKDSEAIWVN